MKYYWCSHTSTPPRLDVRPDRCDVLETSLIARFEGSASCVDGICDLFVTILLNKCSRDTLLSPGGESDSDNTRVSGGPARARGAAAFIHQRDASCQAFHFGDFA